MVEKKIAFENEANHWYWRGKNRLDCQTATLVEIPEDAKITRVEFKIAGLTYNDPVYGYQNKPGYAIPTIWDANSGSILTKGSGRSLPRSPGGTQPWVSFDIPDLRVKAGRRLLVGFWRNSANTAIATQWDYSTAAAANEWTTYGHHLYGSSSGPLKFSKSTTYSGRSLNFRLWYESGGRVKVWNGKAWIPVNPQVRDGSRWAKGTVHVFNGTEWVEASE